MSNMFTPREFGGLIDFAHRTQPHQSEKLQVIWDVDIIGVRLRAIQQFATAPCMFTLAAYSDHDVRWVVMASFERAPNTPHSLFGKMVDDDGLVGMFAVIWRCTSFPRLIEGDDEQFTNDLLMLRMSKDLWEYP